MTGPGQNPFETAIPINGVAVLGVALAGCLWWLFSHKREIERRSDLIFKTVFDRIVKDYPLKEDPRIDRIASGMLPYVLALFNARTRTGVAALLQIGLASGLLVLIADVAMQHFSEGNLDKPLLWKTYRDWGRYAHIALFGDLIFLVIAGVYFARWYCSAEPPPAPATSPGSPSAPAQAPAASAVQPDGGPTPNQQPRPE